MRASMVPAALLDAVYVPQEDESAARADEAVESLLAAIRESTALERCYADAQALVDEARRALSAVQAGPARDALYELAGYIVERHG